MIKDKKSIKKNLSASEWFIEPQDGFTLLREWCQRTIHGKTPIMSSLPFTFYPQLLDRTKLNSRSHKGLPQVQRVNKHCITCRKNEKMSSLTQYQRRPCSGYTALYRSRRRAHFMIKSSVSAKFIHDDSVGLRNPLIHLISNAGCTTRRIRELLCMQPVA